LVRVTFLPLIRDLLASGPWVRTNELAMVSRPGQFTAFLLCFAWLASGCHSTPHVPSSRLAAVLIEGHSVSEVETATQAIFKDDSYELAKQKPGELVFEKEGSNMDTLVYGDWSQKKVWERVKSYVRLLEDQKQVLLDCDVFMVIDLGDPRFEEPHKLTSVHHKHYQKLLEAVKKRLNGKN
jgi:hypothetical protein